MVLINVTFYHFNDIFSGTYGNSTSIPLVRHCPDKRGLCVSIRDKQIAICNTKVGQREIMFA